jgi:hypothetical protein
MPRFSLVFFVILSLFTVPLRAADATVKWNDTIRDVYVDGRLDRSFQMLSSGRTLVLLPTAGQALLFDPAAGEVARAGRENFVLADDHTSAVAPRVLVRTRAGALAQATESVWTATVDGHAFVIVPHQSQVGAMTVDALWATAPTWKAIHDYYTPDAAAVARLRAVSRPTTLRIVCATWCGDSKRHVPRLLKAVDEARNPNLTVELFGIGNDFQQPMDYIRANAIINVPIVLVQRGGREVGRFIETPAGQTVEGDVADLIDGKTLRHPGRSERKELLASGRYALLDRRGGDAGSETFEIYRAPGGGTLLHDEIDRAGSMTETWAALDEKQAPDFAEVTRREGSEVTRTRYFADGAKWTAHARSTRAGIVDQTTTAPATFATPATPTLAWMLLAKALDCIDCYVIGDEGGIGRAELLRISQRRGGYDVAGGSVKRLTMSASQLNVPRIVELADGSRRVLRSFTPASE